MAWKYNLYINILYYIYFFTNFCSFFLQYFFWDSQKEQINLKQGEEDLWSPGFNSLKDSSLLIRKPEIPHFFFYIFMNNHEVLVYLSIVEWCGNWSILLTLLSSFTLNSPPTRHLVCFPQKITKQQGLKRADICSTNFTNI